MPTVSAQLIRQLADRARRIHPPDATPSEALGLAGLLRCAHLLEQMQVAHEHGAYELVPLGLHPIIESAIQALYYLIEPQHWPRADSGRHGVDVGALAGEGHAVLLHTGQDRNWSTDRYGQDAPCLTRAGARWLANRGARLVGIDSVNVDDAADSERLTHSLLLAASIPVVEHLTVWTRCRHRCPLHRHPTAPARVRHLPCARAFASVPGASPAAP